MENVDMNRIQPTPEVPSARRERPSAADYRLIALDLDGTLLNSQKQLTPENADALYTAAEKGVYIVPTTGRFFDGMPQVVRELPFLRYAITINGAQVQDRVTGQVIYRAELPLKQAVEIMRYLDTLPVIYDCYMDNWGWITGSMQKVAAEYAADEHSLKMIQELRTPVEDLKQHLLSRGKDVQKIQFFIKDPSRRAAIGQEIQRRFPGTVTAGSLANNLEINTEKANKGDAVRALAVHLGLDMAQTVSFGDGGNDLSMIQACGLGVAMKNACREVLEAADRITASCDENGVALVIRELLEQKESSLK